MSKLISMLYVAPANIQRHIKAPKYAVCMYVNHASIHRNDPTIHNPQCP